MDAQSKTYDLVEADTTEDSVAFIKAVNQKIADGWTPLGAPLMMTGQRPTGHYRRMVQAMTYTPKVVLEVLGCTESSLEPESDASKQGASAAKVEGTRLIDAMAANRKLSNAQKGKYSNEQRSNA